MAACPDKIALVTEKGYQVKIARQLSIFVVDHERVMATTLTLILQSSGYLAHAFFDPLQALLAARIEAPDLIISDVVMPQLTGVELAIRMKALCPFCKIILLSGQAQTLDLIRNDRDLGLDFIFFRNRFTPLSYSVISENARALLRGLNKICPRSTILSRGYNSAWQMMTL